MLRFLKQTILLAGVIIGCESAFGFALLGPVPAGSNPDDYQVPAIGYALGTGTFTGNNPGISNVGGIAAPGTITSAEGLQALGLSDDIGTPKNIGEGYRRNTPIMYYSFDASFFNFFGPDGAAEVDKAMAIYNSLTNVSSYSADLSEFPQESRRVNTRAATDSLLDIRSMTLGLMTEQLGFFQPSRWVWALHGRIHLPNTPTCPAGMEYTVDRRNLDLVPSDPSNYQYSSYVNGVLYSYFIIEGCTTTPLLADAVEFPVDPLDNPYSAVADFASEFYAGLTPGVFYTSLTRDDVGGLRYLIRQKNLAPETTGGRTIEFVTNSTPVAVTTLDLNLFAAQARTNNAAALTALYPGLVDVSSNFFGLQVSTNITETLVNSPLDPAGFPPTHPVFTTNYSTNFINLFSHTFANVVTNTFSSRGLVASLTIVPTVSPTAPAGTLPTLTTNIKPTIVNGVFGDFFLLPTNVCSVQILSNLLTTIIPTTNLPTILGGGTGTNGTGTNTTAAFTPGSITFFTNHIVVYLPVNCPTNAEGTFGGVEKIRFIRRDYDSLINQAWDPVTNDYTMVELTNSTLFTRHMQRAVPRPDFLFTVADLAAPTGFAYSNTVAAATESLSVTITGLGKYDVFRLINYNQSARPPNTAGPGTIESPLVLPTLMVFNKVGPLYDNSNALLFTNTPTFFLDEQTQLPALALSWGSFDGTTNAPEVYPNGSSIVALENLLTGPAVTTSGLPTANIGANYSAQLNAQGGQAPYTWSLAPGSPTLPAGLNLSPNGQITGAATGPAAIYDFTVRVTDSTGAFKDVAFTITVS